MPGERGGRGIAFLALLISLIALGMSILAYREAGGSLQLQAQVRALQGAVETARRETAAALARLEQAVRPAEKSREASPPPRR